jgi:ABC-type siderophore export system fused ATPase/permease subunit
MNSIISLIVYLVVFGLIWWLINMLPLPAPVAQIVRVLFIILLILIILSAVGILPGGYLPRIHIGSLQ